MNGEYSPAVVALDRLFEWHRKNGYPRTQENFEKGELNMSENETEFGVDPNKQITKASNEWLHPLQPYGAKKALREMTRRIMEMDTGKIPMLPREAAHLAQQAASAWLNPFTGEIWGWVQLRDDQRIFTIMPGRRGLLRHAHEQAREMGTHFWPEYRQITDPDERANLFVPAGALAYEAQVKDHLSQMTWNDTLEKVTEAVKAGIDIDTSIIKSPPFVFGLGILTKQEMESLDKSRGNKMTHVERCQKRAYMMAIKQMFDLPLGGAIGTQGETIEDYVMEGEWREVPAIPPEWQCHACGEGVPKGKDVCPECGAEGQIENDEILFGVDGEPTPYVPSPGVPSGNDTSNGRPYPAAVAREKIESFYDHEDFKGKKKTEKFGETMTLVQAVVVNLNNCFEGNPDPDKDRHTVLAYISRGKSASVKDDFWNGAKLCAIRKWLEVKEWEGQGAGYTPRKESRLEAVSMVATRMKEQGQQELL